MRSGWKEKSVGEILQLEYGKPLDDSDRKPDGLHPVYGANGEKDRTDKFYHDKPSIIVGRKGSAGEINLSENKFWPLDVTYFVTFDEKQHDLRFLYYLLMTLDLPKLAKGVKPGINRNEVYSKVAKVPLLSEQKRIVSVLDEAFGGIATAKANAEKNLQNANALFESYLQSVFTHRGAGWQTKKLGEVCSFLNRGVSPKYVGRGGVAVLNQRCIRDHQISFEVARRHDEKAKKVGSEKYIQAGDVLVNSTGTGTLGRVAQLRENPAEPTTVDSHVTIVRPISGMFFQDFFGYMLVFIENAIKEAGEGCGGQTELARATLAEKFLVNYPTSLQEQEQHTTKLDAMSEETNRLKDLYQQKLTALEALKKSLLHQAFTGELSKVAA